MWILGVAFGRASAAWRPLAASRWLGATPQPPWCRWGKGRGIAAPGLRAGCVGGRHLQTWPRVCRQPEIRWAQRRRPFGGPGPVLKQHRPAGHERTGVLGAAATRHELRRGPAPYAAVAFPGPRQVPIGSSMPVIYLHRAVIITPMFRPEQARLPC